MKKNTSKFDGIAFPLFGLKRKPYKIMYSKDTISCYIHKEDSISTIDNRKYPGDYFSRLLHMSSRIQFDSTCNNIQDIIMSKIRWGIDKNAVIHDLSNLVRVPADYRRVIKIENNLVWVRKISYPFKISSLENISTSDEIYATIIKINGVWYLTEFSYEKLIKSPYVFI